MKPDPRDARNAVRMQMINWERQTAKTNKNSTAAMRSGLRVFRKGLELFNGR